MSASPTTVRLPLPMLAVLVPNGSTLDDAWVVLVGHHEQVTTTPGGQPVYGDVVGWKPVLPVASQTGAYEAALRLGVAALDGVEPDEWLWQPVNGHPEIDELWAVVDSHDERPEVAVAPLTVLLADGSEQAAEVSRG
ncbi:hypothetical protein [Streptosporangium sp. NPDC002721]|uniref:hypothetical protein n=1 Tax=Streptosporangium sp. NPDC002721 TaxID=3366188 RepID=UPI00368B8527